MKPSRHLTGSALLSLLLVPWLAWNALLVLAGGVLLDVDRYLWHALRYRTLELRPAIARFQGRDRIRGGPRFFHSVEFLALLAVASLLYGWVWFFTLGVAFHIALDVFVHKKKGRFWFYFDASHLHCLIHHWLRGRTGVEAPAAGNGEQSESEDEA